jgi:hypothetical protein
VGVATGVSVCAGVGAGVVSAVGAIVGAEVGAAGGLKMLQPAKSRAVTAIPMDLAVCLVNFIVRFLPFFGNLFGASSNPYRIPDIKRMNWRIHYQYMPVP